MLAEYSLPATALGVVAALGAGGLAALAGQPAGWAVGRRKVKGEKKRKSK